MNDYDDDDKPVVSSDVWSVVQNVAPWALGCWFIIIVLIGIVIKIATIIF